MTWWFPEALPAYLFVRSEKYLWHALKRGFEGMHVWLGVRFELGNGYCMCARVRSLWKFHTFASGWRRAARTHRSDRVWCLIRPWAPTDLIESVFLSVIHLVYQTIHMFCFAICMCVRLCVHNAIDFIFVNIGANRLSQRDAVTKDISLWVIRFGVKFHKCKPMCLL